MSRHGPLFTLHTINCAALLLFVGLWYYWTASGHPVPEASPLPARPPSVPVVNGTIAPRPNQRLANKAGTDNTDPARRHSPLPPDSGTARSGQQGGTGRGGTPEISPASSGTGEMRRADKADSHFPEVPPDAGTAAKTGAGQGAVKAVSRLPEAPGAGVATGTSTQAPPAAGVQRGWFDRLLGGFLSAALGAGLFCFAASLLFANEGAHVARVRALGAVEHKLEVLLADRTKPDAGPGGCTPGAVAVKPSHFSTAASAGSEEGGWEDLGELHFASGTVADVPVEDGLCGVRTMGLRLRRVVEMYQYRDEVQRETRKDATGGEAVSETHTLSAGWYEHRVPLSGKSPGSPPGQNPNFPAVRGEPLVSETFTGNPLTLHGAALSAAQVQRLQDWSPLLGAKPHFDVACSEYIPNTCSCYIAYGGYGSCGSVTDPSIGDVRIKWEAVHGGPFTVLCGRAGDQLTHYKIPDSQPFTLPAACVPLACCGLAVPCFGMFTGMADRIDSIVRGEYSASSMTRSLRSEADRIVWLLRLSGYLLFFVSSMMILSPLPTVLDVVGFAGSVARYGTFVVALAVASICAPTTIALAWLSYRPLTAFVIFIPAAVVYYVFASSRL
ncbi:Transmembrane protein 43-like protein [Diplonema papillatum]|nr:Transmembrane protein 43-like protein [Diplonema papillatum]